MKVTKKDVENWLGSDNTEQEAILVILDIANGIYEPETLQKDILKTKGDIYE